MKLLALIATALVLSVAGSACADDRVDCVQATDTSRSIRGCSNLINAGSQSVGVLVVAHSHRGLAHFLEERFTLAIYDFVSAIGLDPDNAIDQNIGAAYYGRGRQNFKNLNYSLAISDFRSALHFFDESDPRRRGASERIAESEKRIAETAGAPAIAATVSPAPPSSYQQAENESGSFGTDLEAASPDALTTGRRVALIVANEAYAGAPLKNPLIDAGLVLPVLEQLGFETKLVTNADLQTFILALESFYADAQGADFAEKRLLMHRLRAGVDVRDFRHRLREPRDQTPPRHDQLALAVTGIDTENGYLVGGRDVVARREVRLR